MGEWLSRRGWRDVTRDVTCAGDQVEVKMQTRAECAHVTRRQLARLGRAAARLAEVEPVQLALALVESDKVRLLPVDALTPF